MLLKNKIIVVIGATACGKSAYGVKLAKEIGGEIINTDSMQVYKEIPILTAIPTEGERQGVPHHLYGMVHVGEHFSVGNWLKLAIPVIEEVRARGNIPILVGGTGMYIKCLIEGLNEIPPIPESVKQQMLKFDDVDIKIITNKLKEIDPKASARLRPNDRQRMLRAIEVMLATGRSIFSWHEEGRHSPYPRDEFHVIHVVRSRAEIYDRINRRFLSMLEDGALEEVKKIADVENLPRAVGLQELRGYLVGDISLNEAVQKAQQASRNYAKRQLTWIRHQLVVNEEVV